MKKKSERASLRRASQVVRMRQCVGTMYAAIIATYKRIMNGVGS